MLANNELLVAYINKHQPHIDYWTARVDHLSSPNCPLTPDRVAKLPVDVHSWKYITNLGTQEDYSNYVCTTCGAISWVYGGLNTPNIIMPGYTIGCPGEMVKLSKADALSGALITCDMHLIYLIHDLPGLKSWVQQTKHVNGRGRTDIAQQKLDHYKQLIVNWKSIKNNLLST